MRAQHAFQICDVAAQFTGLLVLGAVTLQTILVELTGELKLYVFDNFMAPKWHTV